MMRSNWTSLGFISRIHGLKGEVVLEPEFDAELYTTDRIYYLGKLNQDPVPVRISAFKLVKKGDQLSFFVTFEHISDRTEAERLKGYSVFLPSEELEIDEFPEGDLVGYRVLNDDSGTDEGEVVDMIDNPAHVLLQVVDDGAYFIPLVDEFIVEIDDEQRIIRVSGIEELKSLNG
jgi:16S rRNA processing protein RimM